MIELPVTILFVIRLFITRPCLLYLSKSIILDSEEFSVIILLIRTSSESKVLQIAPL